MIGILCSNGSADAGAYVLAAVRRSVSATQVQPVSRGALRSRALDVIVAVDVPDDWGVDVLAWLKQQPRKLLVLGRVPAALVGHLGAQMLAFPENLPQASRSDSAPSGGARESLAAVQYTSLARELDGREWRRPFERFDFTDEWNNLGYGAIRADGSIWSVAQALKVPVENLLASVEFAAEAQFAYAGMWDTNDASVLWFNRPVGPCDSFEWRIVERFLSSHRSSTLRCHPVLSEVPWGYDAAVTSRLDCDEDVESARPLWQAYQRLGVPFTLAVHTQNLARPDHHAILRELVAEGAKAAVLSHTATHAPNWGGSYEAALEEGCHSAALLQNVTGKAVRYAVSPFHQSPPYALRGLADAGYDGCVGGIIRNDPEFVLARGGALAHLPDGFIGHSQQCMLHGDCMLKDGDPVAVYKQAFDLAFETGTLFGYLDHPFSPRYQYGWVDESTRIGMHETLIAYIRSRAKHPLFMNEEVALDFIREKSRLELIESAGVYRVTSPESDTGPFAFGVEFKGERICAELEKPIR